MEPHQTLNLLLRPETSGVTSSRFRSLRTLWKALPLPVALRTLLTGLVYRLSGRARALAELDQAVAQNGGLLPRPAADIEPGRLVLSGYLTDTSGIGRGGRLSLAAFKRAGLNPHPHDLRRSPEGWGRREPGGVWFCHCNAIEASEFLLRSRDAHDCYRVGYWAWELPHIPPQWVAAIPLFHEIWAPSRFVQDALERVTPQDGPVIRRVPHPRPAVAKVRPDRRRYGLADNVFAFLCMYDVHSSATRKNPMGAVDAFQLAFRPDRSDVLLLVKVVAATDSQSCLDELAARTAGWPNIRILTEMLSDGEADELICSADAFVSLHRSEGFGLSIAQAMAMGRPVIVTAWSGNMDFCGKGAALVNYTLAPAVDAHGVYRAFEAPNQVWADPHLADAADAMRRFAADPAQARRLGAQGKRHIRDVLPEGYETDHLRRWIVEAAPAPRNAKRTSA